MTDINPPPELIKDWLDEWNESDQIVHSVYTHIAIRAAQWGADQELEACFCEVSFLGSKSLANRVRATRRPKPKSLKEQALKTLEEAPGPDHPMAMTVLNAEQHALIRRALEALPND